MIRQRWATLIAFDMLFKALAAFVFLPGSAWLFARLVAVTGRVTVSNTDIISFFLSPVGMVAAVVSVCVTFWIALVEGAGYTVLASGVLFGIDLRVLDALYLLAKSARRLMRLAVRMTAVVGALTVPVLLVMMWAYQRWLAEFDIYYVVTQRPPELWMALAIVAPCALALALALAWIYARWFLALAVFVIEGTSASETLRTSARQVAGHRRLIWTIALGWLVLGVVVPVGIVTLFEFGGDLAFGMIGERYPALALTTGFLGLAYVGALSGVTLVGLVGVNTMASSLYYRCRPVDQPPSPGALARWSSPRHRVIARYTMTGGLIAGGIAAIAGTASVVDRLRLEPTVRITAHRGSSLRAPENSLSALRAAIDDGAHIAEIDVQETSDGAIVVIHDSDLRRIAGDSRGIWEVSSAELETLDAGSWFGPSFANERIPTLEQAISLVRGRMGLNIELKFNGHDERLVERVVEIVRREGFTEEAVITSLDYRALQDVRAVTTALPVGFIVASTVSRITRLDVELLAVDQRRATPSFIRATQRAGKEVHVWTVNDRAGMQRFIELGVDNIMTDDPAMLRDLLAERAALSDPEKWLLTFRNWLWASR
ncbi:MAG: glycerophosphoryl diester phosphodiesterase membrane domain-containing protein [Gemmatimonadetes bacterium]|nr:glycerophosphoryl diester phosphodiesterase membrane domain-containing protein [Gemmatimonadota bacterium]